MTATNQTAEDLNAFLNHCDNILHITDEAQSICEPYSETITGIGNPKLTGDALNAALDLMTHYAESHLDAIVRLAQKRGVIDDAASGDTEQKPAHPVPAPSPPTHVADCPRQ